MLWVQKRLSKRGKSRGKFAFDINLGDQIAFDLIVKLFGMVALYAQGQWNRQIECHHAEQGFRVDFMGVSDDINYIVKSECRVNKGTDITESVQLDLADSHE